MGEAGVARPGRAPGGGGGDGLPPEAAFFFGAALDVFLAYRLSHGGRMEYCYVNEAGGRCLQTDPRSVVGKTNEELFGAEAAEGIDCHVRRCFQEQRELDIEHALQLPGGARTFSTVYTYMERDGDKFVFGVCRDITERKEMERAANAAREKAEEAARAKSIFLANMSHDLRTPLVGIVNGTQLLEITTLDSEQRGLVDVLRTSADVLLTLCNDVTDITKAEQHALELQPAEFELEPCLRNCMGMVEAGAHEKGLGLDCKLGHGAAHARVLLDEQRVKQVVYNLLSNAVKYSDDGSVTLSTTVVEQGEGAPLLEVAVSDHGCGIQEDHIQALFRPFSQFFEGEPELRAERGRQGSGLGLAISRRLADLMGGSLECISVEGRGSTFTLTVPLPPTTRRDGREDAPAPSARPVPPEHTENEPPETNASGAAECSRLRKRKFSVDGPEERPEIDGVKDVSVFIVEDNDVSRQILEKMLRREGVRHIAMAEDGQRFLEQLHARSERFDLVLMDRNMPVMSGMEAVRQLRRDMPQALQPFVAFLTADAMRSSGKECLESGADLYITKPITKQGLSKLLEQAAGNRARMTCV